MLAFVIGKYLGIKVASVEKWNKFLLMTDFTCVVEWIRVLSITDGSKH